MKKGLVIVQNLALPNNSLTYRTATDEKLGNALKEQLEQDYQGKYEWLLVDKEQAEKLLKGEDIEIVCFTPVTITSKEKLLAQSKEMPEVLLVDPTEYNQLIQSVSFVGLMKQTVKLTFIRQSMK